MHTGLSIVMVSRLDAINAVFTRVCRYSRLPDTVSTPIRNLGIKQGMALLGWQIGD